MKKRSRGAMDSADDVKLSLQTQFTYESLRRSVQSAEDMEKLREFALRAIGLMEEQQKTTQKLLRNKWFRKL